METFFPLRLTLVSLCPSSSSSLRFNSPRTARCVPLALLPVFLLPDEGRKNRIGLTNIATWWGKAVCASNALEY
jgi:hypothetical protein